MVKWRTGYIINHHLCFDQNTQHPAKKCLTLANQRFLLYEYPRQIALPIILMVLWKVASIQACQNLNTRLRTHISTPWWGPTLLQTLPAPFIFSYIHIFLFAEHTAIGFWLYYQRYLDNRPRENRARRKITPENRPKEKCTRYHRPLLNG